MMCSAMACSVKADEADLVEWEKRSSQDIEPLLRHDKHCSGKMALIRFLNRDTVLL